MKDTIRDSFVGQILHAASGGKILPYAEERPGFEVPEKYKKRDPNEKNPKRFPNEDPDEHGLSEAARNVRRAHLQERRSRGSEETVTGSGSGEDRDNSGQGEGGGEGEEDEVEKAKKDAIIVDWYGDDDPENPLNWKLSKKCGVTAMIMLMTSSVYMGSSIWTPGIQDAMQYFGLGQVTVTLGLSLFVVGYAVGPLFLSPITEIPHIGRTLPYIVCLFLFTVLQVPTALVTNFAGFAILRFLAGFVGSPPLATGGASIQDMYTPHKVPYAMGLWGLSAASAPALAPIVASFAVEAKGWRWAFYEMLWLSGGSLAILLFLLPETSGPTILLRRAQRLRKLTGNDKIKSESEVETQHMSVNEIAKMSLLKPFTMIFKEPIVLAINLYIGLIYAILYSYFESFPLVYGPTGYGFSLGVSTLPFLALLVGALISYSVYAVWNRVYFEPKFHKLEGRVKPEMRLPMSMVGAFCFPICLFWFAWTSNRTHWISPVIASGFFGLGTTWMFMPFLTYLPHAYPTSAASVLASNDFVRSMMGAGMPLASVPLFHNIGIAWGNTMLGCLTVLFIPIPFILYKKGAWLRERSPNALKDKQIEEQDADPAAEPEKYKNKS